VVGRLETCGHVSALRPGLSPPCEGAGWSRQDLLAGECEKLYTATDKTRKANGCTGGHSLVVRNGVGNKMDGDVSAAMRERTAEDSQEDIWGEMAQGFIRQGRNAARPDF
jgi:hypothetical protein